MLLVGAGEQEWCVGSTKKPSFLSHTRGAVSDVVVRSGGGDFLGVEKAVSSVLRTGVASGEWVGRKNGTSSRC